LKKKDNYGAQFLLFFLGFALFLISILLFLTGPEFIRSRMEAWQIPAERAGEIGDVFGGTLGPIIALVGSLLTFAAFSVQYIANQQQRNQFEKQSTNAAIERFEGNYFELIRLHRDNVSALKYEKFYVNDVNLSEGRKVFRIILREFFECYRDVKRFSKSKNPDDYYKVRYKERIAEVFSSVNPSIDLVEVAQIDIAYSIVFFGLGDEGEIVLRHRFLKKYKDEYFFRLLKYMRLKPKGENKAIYTKWELLQRMNKADRKNVLDELYEYRLHQDISTLSPAAWIILTRREFDKYYGGHQHRLGHYFRHLFQSYKYLNEQSVLKEDEKYFYGKMLRAQLSTYEQLLLFINSLSSLGMKWEITPDLPHTDLNNLSSSELQLLKSNRKLITKYQLIKNVPGSHFFDIVYKRYYPNIHYEDDEWFSK
jgi:hypothetical protein